MDRQSTTGGNAATENPEEDRRAEDAAATAKHPPRRRRVSATESTQAPPQPWRGQEVEDAPDGEAEAAADIAAGRVPARPGDDRDPDPGLTERAPPMSAEDERQNQELKRQAAAEDHEEDRATGGGTAPKNL